MACWVFCNRCFQPPRTTSCFSLTNCGHVFCDTCLGKGQGRKDECLICRAPCHLVLLSRQTGSDIQALFTRVDGLCARYSRELSQISGFQEKHRKRLLAFYRESIRRLEDSLRTVTVQIQRMQGTRSAQLWALGGVKSAASAPSSEPSGPRLLPLRTPNLASRDHTGSQPHPGLGTAPRWPADQEGRVDVEAAPPLPRKPEVATGPARISLISPPQDGRMGSVSHHCTPGPHLTPAYAGLPQLLRPLTPQLLGQGRPRTPALQMPVWGVRGDMPTPSPLCQTSAQAQPRAPISISGLLQKRQPGSTDYGAPRLEQ